MTRALIAITVLAITSGCTSSESTMQRAIANYNASPSQRAIADYQANGPSAGMKAADEEYKAAANRLADLDRAQLTHDITKYGASNVYDCRSKAAAVYGWDAGYTVYSNCILASVARAPQQPKPTVPVILRNATTHL